MAARAGEAPCPAPKSADEQRRLLALVEEMKAPPAPPPDDPKKERFRKARDIESRIAAGLPVAEDERRWNEVYARSAEYRAGVGMYREFGEQWLNPPWRRRPESRDTDPGSESGEGQAVAS